LFKYSSDIRFGGLTIRERTQSLVFKLLKLAIPVISLDKNAYRTVVVNIYCIEHFGLSPYREIQQIWH